MACKKSSVRVRSAPLLPPSLSIRSGDRSDTRVPASSPAKGASEPSSAPNDSSVTVTFAVGLGAMNAATCIALQDYFGCGSIFRHARRKPHYDDEVAFTVAAFVDHVEVTIPFMDAHLPESYKREQYLVWRAQLVDDWEHGAKRVRPCTVEGCDRPRRAHGLCRRHLYAARGV
jgi:hypothetical protein